MLPVLVIEVPPLRFVHGKPGLGGLGVDICQKTEVSMGTDHWFDQAFRDHHLRQSLSGKET